MSNITTFSGGKVPSVFKDVAITDDLSAGVTGSFAVMSFRSSRWRIKYQKEEQLVTNADGDPAASIDAVIIKANPRLSKNYYEQGYAEGAAEAPDCFSMDSLRPDAGAPKKQSTSCATCAKNVFGSRITPAGKKAKACQDNRRLAIVPLNDLHNEVYGGPMLLRVPAASLADLSSMGAKLRSQGFPYTAVAVRIGFDVEASFPKLTFRPLRPLTDEEAAIVASHLEDEKVDRILAESVELRDVEVAEDVPGSQETLFIERRVQPAKEQAVVVNVQPTVVASAETATKVAAAKPAKPAAKPAVKPAAVSPPVENDDITVSSGSLDDDIRNILGGLDSLS